MPELTPLQLQILYYLKKQRHALNQSVVASAQSGVSGVAVALALSGLATMGYVGRTWFGNTARYGISPEGHEFLNKREVVR